MTTTLEPTPPTTPVEPMSSRRRTSRSRLYLRRFLRNKQAVVGVVIFALLVLLAIVGPSLTKWKYDDLDFVALFSPPSAEHWFGTNALGGDHFAQIVHGLGRSLIIALSVSVLSTVISAFIGAAAAYLGGWPEKIILAIIHFLLVVPSFLLLALLSNRAGGDWRVLIFVMVIFGWMFSARVIWSLSTSIREREYIAAAKYMGVSGVRIVLRHMIPNIGSLLVLYFTLGTVQTVMSETALSFLGFGVRVPDVSLGTLLADGVGLMAAAPWIFYFTAGTLVLLTVSMAFIADGLRDALDPNSASGGRA